MQEPKYSRLFADDSARIDGEASAAQFSLDYLKPKGWQGRLIGALFRAVVLPVLWILRRVWPVLRIGRFVIVTRADDITAILGDPASFPVPYQPEMEAMGKGATFLLGLEGEPHDRQRALIQKVVRRDDLARLRHMAECSAVALLDAGKGCIDVQGDLVQRVAAESCAQYFGLRIDDADQYAQWTIGCSNLLFADPFGDPIARTMGLTAARRMGAIIDTCVQTAITSARPDDTTLLGRLVALHLAGAEDAPSPDEIRAILLGLSVGFVPTNSMGGGKILQYLAHNRTARDAAITAARARDEAGFAAILREVMRLNPAIAPGQWRWTQADAAWSRTKTGKTFSVPAGRAIMVATQIGLRDPSIVAHPGRFDPKRTDAPPFVFGNHAHSCLGEHVAIAQLTGTLFALFAREGIETALAKLSIEWIGPFPARAMIEYACPDAAQTGVVIAIPAPGADLTALDTAIRQIDPDVGPVRKALDETACVHFCSMMAFAAPAAGKTPKGTQTPPTEPLIVIELNVDGNGDRGIEAFADALHEPLMALLKQAGLPEPEHLAGLLKRHRIPLTSSPWGATSLQFYGRQGFTVDDIDRQSALSAQAGKILDDYLRATIGRVASAYSALRHVRYLLRMESPHTPDGIRSLMYALLKPSGRPLDISTWDPPTDNTPWFRSLLSPLIVRFLGVLAAISLALCAVQTHWTPPKMGAFVWWAGTVLGLIGKTVLLTLVLAAAVIAVLGLILRRHELRDPEDKRLPTLQHMKDIAEREDRPGYVHNHIFVLTPLKRGLFRRLTLALGLWGIAEIVTRWFRPGFVLNMGTIHFARWVRLPGRDAMIFQSNYDGSWESYLEDFITRAHFGQTMAWSNAEGFPRSRYMIFDGAADGDHFKRYVRGKQLPTAFWYARFTHLTNATIRRNAMIHDGLCRVRTESEARAWLALFGSAQRTPATIESDEVQSIVFSGFGKLPHSTTLFLRFTGSSEAARGWLGVLSGYRMPQHKDTNEFLATDNEMAEAREAQLRSFHLAFGEDERLSSAVSLGFTAEGLRALGMPSGRDGLALAGLPAPFAMGMAERGRRLGDTGEEAPSQWRWTDGGDQPVHAVLLLYADTADALKRLEEIHRRYAEDCEIEVEAEIALMPLGPRGTVTEHFGFRDGLVQPVIAGTRRAAQPRVASDIVPAGEMILGYKNAQGYRTPGIPVSADLDPQHRLPEMTVVPRPFPRFGMEQDVDGLRDFGRNGTFLAIRMLEQDVRKFDQATEAAARHVRTAYPTLRLALGRNVDANWIAAKMVGRWRNGAPLLGNPNMPADAPEERPMLFGTSDPAGYECPLGAHIRRANPRDSFQPGDETELSIVNRHRLLRRGRSYQLQQDGGRSEKGLLFMALCEDLERQFEFVQRSWIDFSAFHELDRQNDPLIGRCPAGHDRQFEIPTPSGPVTVPVLGQFVTLRAGGYFFVPSRSAILWLSDLPENEDTASAAS